MSRYTVDVSPPSSPGSYGWWDAGPLIPGISTADHRPVDTGLVDASGNRIMRMPNPIGFGRDDEWR